MEDSQFYRKLVKRYVDQKISPEELEVFYHLLEEGKLDVFLLESMEKDIEEVSDKVPFSFTGLAVKVGIAASVLIFFGLLIYILQENGNKQYNTVDYSVNDKESGTDKATLTLSTGEVIDLTASPKGELKGAKDFQVIKSSDGSVRYIAQKNRHELSETNTFNTIKVPAGGRYQIELEDGTKVWLNAASSLTFPTAFAKDMRKVRLEGEAYFEVKSGNSKHHKPFIVETATQSVKVLGTHFNVNAYLDEQRTKTTLLEGKVNVLTARGSTILQPGQQAAVSKEGHSSVAQVEVESIVDWKNGDFIFADEELRSVMRKLSRWYDVEVVYDKDMSNETFSGQISRDKNLSEVLKILSLSGDISFRLKNNVLYLSPKTGNQSN